MVVVRLCVTGYTEKTRLHSLSFVDMNRTLSRTALNTKHVWPVWLRTENWKILYYDAVSTQLGILFRLKKL